MATAMELIAQESTDQTNSIIFHQCFSADYDKYYLTYTFGPSSNSDNINLRVYTGANNTEQTGSDYETAHLDMNAWGTFSDVNIGTSDALKNFGITHSHADSNGGSQVMIYTPYSSTNQTMFFGRNSSYYNDGYERNRINIGRYKTSETVTGIKIYGSLGGNIREFGATLYGIK